MAAGTRYVPHKRYKACDAPMAWGTLHFHMQRAPSIPAHPVAVPPPATAVGTSRLVRLLVGTLLAVALLRAVLFGVYAVVALGSPYPVFCLEGANVHLAWRVAHQLPLYPDSSSYPFTLNYMGPAYFATVGLLGRWFAADIPGLYLMGRLVTVASGLALAVILYGYLVRRLGRIPALAGALLALGSGTMVGFGVMVRPDAVADVLGVAGFLVAVSAGNLGLGGAAVLLALACLTKQTAGIYLLAAVVSLWIVAPGKRSRAVWLAAGTGAMVVAVPLIGYRLGEPRLWAGLVSQGQIGFDVLQFPAVLGLLCWKSPELIWFLLLGASVWLDRSTRNVPLATLAITVLLVALVTVAKKGSDLNYFLCFRAIAALGAATLCHTVLHETAHPRRAACLLFLSLAALVPSLATVSRAAAGQVQGRWLHAGRPCPPAAYAEALRLARDRRHPVLADWDALAVHQDADTPLLDPYLFRLRVEAGQIDPRPLIDRLAQHHFSKLLLTVDPANDRSAPYFWKLPTAVAAAVQAHYRFDRQLGPWRVYVPR